LLGGGEGLLLVGQLALDLDVGTLDGGEQALRLLGAAGVLYFDVADERDQDVDVPRGDLLLEGGFDGVLEL
jgi:hypothetical protein